ncbi:HTH-type transcriptional repressor CsiR [Variibacter gotjawalensis]|uniref:HTH-type transcriptional repressor CsiR n=1 Tax=Variibacter gotjawalensis TaxID=1333996 RepID=A0A0S3PRN0_9BRAD|nr:GntR family transcriptional regulator [Variibacter gotjawalensis]NIK48908.1 DNA-binding GntR family transcriptional regulator [Variibacter gotjawalensis]RZS50764.1 GntR family transcriptional regulator [Variibacter gotjawalensis]BAT58598.1 HTH-type transcriptional repressor CsiR [Variibacter gotjawalensis]
MSGRGEQAWARLRGAILSGELPPGKKLPFQQLQDICGMSVSPVREALTRLVAGGLVEGEHNRGYRVTTVSRRDLDDLVSLRIKLDGWALERAIEVGDDEWEALCVADLHRLERVPRKLEKQRLHNEAWEERHAKFHASILSACDSPLLIQFSEQLYARADRYRRLSLTVEFEPRDVEEEHRAILDALLKRKKREAKMLLAQHYEATAAVLRKHLDEQEASQLEA